jgi:hypothetical protein
MCELCHSIGRCLDQCPNADIPTPMTHCAKCTKELYEGDEVLEISSGVYWCPDCAGRAWATLERP